MIQTTDRAARPAMPAQGNVPWGQQWHCLLLTRPQPGHPRFQLRRQRRFDADLAAGRGLVKADAIGMKEISSERRAVFDFRGRAVDCVARNRVAETRQMNPNLVRTPGANADFQQSEFGEPAKHAVFGARLAALRETRGHTGSPNRIARDRLMDAAVVGLYFPMDQRNVNFFDLPAGELRGQCLVREVGFGNQQDSAGESVETVNDAGAQRPASARKRAEAMQQRVHYSSRMNTGAGMHDHPGGLIYGDQVVIFIQDSERDVFRLGAQRSKLGGLHFNRVFAADQVRGPALGPVHAHAPTPDPLLNARPAECRQTLMEHLVEPFAGVAVFGD